MKKLIVVTLMLSIAGIAFASSLALPWFVDNPNKLATGLPPSVKGTVGVVYLKNNTNEVTTCSIAYYTQGGLAIGPPSPGNTFAIQPKASLAFRPCAYDPDTVVGGQEAVDAGLLVPDRPPHGNSSLLPVVPGNEAAKMNGSAVVTWLGEGSDVQGIYVSMQTTGAPALKVLSWAHLLPPGA